jgi:hypothetical protein
MVQRNPRNPDLKNPEFEEFRLSTIFEDDLVTSKKL